MEKVLVAMSGGVDSAVAALRLCEQGFSVEGVTLCLIPEKSDDQKAKTVCQKLGIPHNTLHLENEFAQLVQKPFADAYFAGLTPNPCVICNKKIKFGALMDYAQKRGFDKLATGHYAKTETADGETYIAKSADVTKDQTYMLWQLDKSVIQKVIFPLGDYLKSQNRQKAEEYGLFNAQSPDSQDICFIEDGDYAGFIEKFTGKKSPCGEFVNSAGEVLGRHQGIIRYTVGQRKGLGIALGAPAFVTGKDAKTGKVTLGKEEDLFYNKVILENVNMFVPQNDFTVTAKLRYSQKEYPAKLKVSGKDGILYFETPQRAPAPGQTAVFYRDGLLLGGGIIVKGEKQ